MNIEAANYTSHIIKMQLFHIQYCSTLKSLPMLRILKLNKSNFSDFNKK